MVKDGRATASPVNHLDQINAGDDVRHDRRNLSADELSRLLTAAMTGARNHRMDGMARAMLYRVAMETGLRRNELRSLTPDCVDFSSDRPTITVQACYTKNRKLAVLPIRTDVARELRAFIDGRAIASDAKLWPEMTKQTAKMIRRDLEAARAAWLGESTGAERDKREQTDFLAYKDSAGLFADFHALRHSYISLITRGGVHPKLAQQLARHSDINLTMSRYSHTVLADEAQALDVLPSFPSAFGLADKGQGVLAATGTDDGRPNVDFGGRSALQSCLQERGAEGGNWVHSDASKKSGRESALRGCDESEKHDKTAGKPTFPVVSNSGEGGIRTPGRVAPTPVFKTGAIDRSATSPKKTFLTRHALASSRSAACRPAHFSRAANDWAIKWIESRLTAVIPAQVDAVSKFTDSGRSRNRQIDHRNHQSTPRPAGVETNHGARSVAAEIDVS
jgi:integrase